MMLKLNLLFEPPCGT